MTVDLSHVTADTRTWVRGPAVPPLQRLLQLPANGLGNLGVRSTLYDYQVSHGLRPDAIFGPVTAAVMLAGI